MIKKSLLGLSLLGVILLSGCQLRDVTEYTQTSRSMDMETTDKTDTEIKHSELVSIDGLDKVDVTNDMNVEMITAIVNHTITDDSVVTPDKFVIQIYDSKIEKPLAKALANEHPDKEFIIYTLRENSSAKVDIESNFLIVVSQPNHAFKELKSYISTVTVDGKEEYLDNTIYYQTKMNYQSYEAVGSYEFTKGNTKEIISYGISSTIKD